MELLQKDVKPLYFKYLAAAFGSALIGAVYSFVDMAVIGQYEGPSGAAAMAIIMPVWNIIFSLGILTGVGGSVLYSAAKGKEGKSGAGANGFFTASILATIVLAAASWLLITVFDRQLLMFLGAEGELLELGVQYLRPLKPVIPFCVFSQTLAAFLRNDNNPALATAAVVSTCLLNIAGDYFFTFTLDMGMYGAALATGLCNVISVLIMLTHFVSKRNTLKLARPTQFLAKCKAIVVTGFSTFFADIAMGILTMLFNHQILRYLGTDALAVYGVIASVVIAAQCCAYSIGQAAQPILSTNYGAGQGPRIKQTLRYAMGTAAAFGLLWTVIILAFPSGLVRLFMSPTPGVLAIAPEILRCYGISFLLLPLNVFSTYYFQSLMKPMASFGVSVARGLLVSGGLILLLPAVFGASAIWFAMPVTELVVAAVVLCLMVRYTKDLPNRQLSRPQAA